MFLFLQISCWSVAEGSWYHWAIRPRRTQRCVCGVVSHIQYSRWYHCIGSASLATWRGIGSGRSCLNHRTGHFCMFNASVLVRSAWERACNNRQMCAITEKSITAARVCCEHGAPLQHRLLSVPEAQPGAGTLSPSADEEIHSRRKNANFLLSRPQEKKNIGPVRGCTADKAWICHLQCQASCFPGYRFTRITVSWLQAKKRCIVRSQGPFP